MVKIFILLANVLLPITAAYLALHNPAIEYRWTFVTLITAHVCIRMWETFYTSREKDPQKFEGDWTLLVGTLAYIGLLFIITAEFFLAGRQILLPVSLLGIVLYAIATRIRWWGTLTLGSQWAVHVVGKQKTKKGRLLKIGPYEFVRNPIYSGILLEEIAIPLLMNTFYALLFVLLVNIPLLIVRLILEERNSESKFERFEYEEYKRSVGRLFPKKNWKKFFVKLIGAKV